LADVSVVVDGTGRGAVTQADGNFIIVGVPAGTHTVRVRRIGFSSPPVTVTVPAGGTANVSFALEHRVAILEEVVTTGYGSQRRLAITGSVATIDATQANVGVQPNVTNMIEGRAAGVQITQNSGDPGAGAQITIRGGSSMTSPASLMNTRSWKASEEAGCASRADTSAVSESGSRTSSSIRSVATSSQRRSRGCGRSAP